MKPAIYTAPIPLSGRGLRRELEAQVRDALVAQVFGTDVVLSHREDGSPYIPSRPEVFISVSHCSDECVLAVSDTPVGVDIETARPTLRRVASKYLTPAEQARAPHSLTELMQLWAAKEAVFKCAGIPTLVISEIGISPDLTTATLFRDNTTSPRRFTLTYLHLTTEKVIAVAKESLIPIFPE